jgi:hypothetical protein
MRIEKASQQRLKNFFFQLTRKAFGQLQVGDQQIADYVSDVLTDFSVSDRWLRLRDAEGRRLTTVVEMLLSRLGPDSDQRMADERRVRKYVGDYTLFMSGLFRKYVERGGFLNWYLEEGKRSYQAVSVLDASVYRPDFVIFEELARGFEHYAGALDYMRKCFFAPGPKEDPFSGFFREIEGWMRHGLSDN